MRDGPSCWHRRSGKPSAVPRYWRHRAGQSAGISTQRADSPPRRVPIGWRAASVSFSRHHRLTRSPHSAGPRNFRPRPCPSTRIFPLHPTRRWSQISAGSLLTRSCAIPPTTSSLALLCFRFDMDHMLENADGSLSNFRYYCAQREAVETAIWLYEVRRARDKFDLLRFDASGDVSAGMFPEDWPRYVLKMATGAGKTNVLSLLIVWSFFHRLYEPDSALSRNFLVIAPNIIVLERLRADFDGPRIFFNDPILPDNGHDGRNWRDDFQVTLHIQDDVRVIRDTGNIFLTNVHRVFLGDVAEPSLETTTCAIISSLGSVPSRSGKPRAAAPTWARLSATWKSSPSSMMRRTTSMTRGWPGSNQSRTSTTACCRKDRARAQGTGIPRANPQGVSRRAAQRGRILPGKAGWQACCDRPDQSSRGATLCRGSDHRVPKARRVTRGRARIRVRDGTLPRRTR